MKDNLKSVGMIVGGIAALVLCACCGSAILSGIGDMFDDTPHAGLATGAAVVVAGAVTAVWLAFQGWRARREMAAWTEWEELPATGPWPWDSALLRLNRAVPQRVRMGTVDGLRVIAGEISWVDDIFPRLTDTQGTGVFVTVRPPRLLPPVAVLRRRQSVGKKFEDRFDVFGEGKHLVDDVLRHVHFEETVPPWKLEGGELIVVVRFKEPIRPRHMIDTARRAAWIMRLLLLQHSRQPS